MNPLLASPGSGSLPGASNGGRIHIPGKTARSTGGTLTNINGAIFTRTRIQRRFHFNAPRLTRQRGEGTVLARLPNVKPALKFPRGEARALSHVSSPPLYFLPLHIHKVCT